MQINLTELVRAIHLDAEPRAESGCFSVWEGGRQYFVDYRVESCTCGARRRLCRHLLRVALCMGEPSVLDRLRLLVPNPESAAA